MISLNQESLKKWQEQNLEHLRYKFIDVKSGDYCIDIGSYQREWANEMIKRYNVKVECFEALDNRAAWVENGFIDMGGQFYYTSLFVKDNIQRFRCVDIAPFLTKEVAVMKMNIEGGEYKLLEYIIDKGLIQNIRNLQVQFHQIEGAEYKRLYDLLTLQLSQTHELTWRYPFCWEQWKRRDMHDLYTKPIPINSTTVS